MGSDEQNKISCRQFFKIFQVIRKIKYYNYEGRCRIFEHPN